MAASHPDKYSLTSIVESEGRLLPIRVAQFGGQIARQLSRVHARDECYGELTAQDVDIEVSGDEERARLLPPGQDKEGRVSPARDLWELGRLLYQLLTGAPQGEEPRLPVELPDTNRDLTDTWNDVLQRLLAPSRGAGQQDASQFANELQRLRGRILAQTIPPDAYISQLIPIVDDPAQLPECFRDDEGDNS